MIRGKQKKGGRKSAAQLLALIVAASPRGWML